MAKPIFIINIRLHLTIFMAFKILYLNTHHSLLDFCRVPISKSLSLSKNLLLRCGSIIVWNG